MVWYGAVWRGMAWHVMSCHIMSCQSRRPELIPTTATGSPPLESLVDFFLGGPELFPEIFFPLFHSFHFLHFLCIGEKESQKKRKPKFKSGRKDGSSHSIYPVLDRKRTLWTIQVTDQYLVYSITVVLYLVS